MFRLLHNLVCWLLSAVMLLTNGLPVAVQHAHDVGDNPYHHSHQLPIGPDVIRHMPAIGEADTSVIAVTEHVHMLWLGWEVTILPPKGGRPSPSPSTAAVGMLAKLVETENGDDDGLRTAIEATPYIASISPSITVDAKTVFADSSVRVAALPLCETARHLRSGVQLI